MKTDIDLLMIQNGELIIGEAKANTSGFNKKQFEQLSLIANAIRPDKIILAYKDGDLPIERVENLKAELYKINCELITHRIYESHYWFGRLGTT